MSLTHAITPLWCILGVLTLIVGQEVYVTLHNDGQRLDVDTDVHISGNLTGVTINGLLREISAMKDKYEREVSLRDAQIAEILLDMALLRQVVLSTTTEGPATFTTIEVPNTTPEVVHGGDFDVTEENWESLQGVSRIVGYLRINHQQWLTNLDFLRSLTSVGWGIHQHREQQRPHKPAWARLFNQCWGIPQHSIQRRTH